MRKEVIAHKDPKSPISEIFRTLRTNIQFMNASKKMKTLLITSTFPGEGKSWVTSNLAVTFAQAGKKVVLIDADMRKGRQYVIFGALPKPGLSNYLSQVEIDEQENLSENISDYIQETEVENLYLMPAGNVPPNPSELLVSTQMLKLLEELKNICDIVIIDGTPCELVADSIILSRIVDSTIVVTAHKITKKEALARVIKNIKNVEGKIAGVVVNKVPVSSKKYEETYYYYDEPKNVKKQISKREKINYSKTEQMNRQKISENVTATKKQGTAKKRTVTVEKQNKPTANEELPKAIKKKVEVEKAQEITIDKTNDILKQVNQYLEQEKKNLNNE